MHAVILAGGKGMRLRPYTTALPKCLVPVGGELTIIDILLAQLAGSGFETVTLAISHLGDLIRAYVGEGSRFGLRVEYAYEQGSLSTAGPLFGMKDSLPEQFLTLNGDILTDLDYRDLMSRHAVNNAPVTVATTTRHFQVDFGVPEVEGGHLIAFDEKPTLAYRVVMGAYAVSRSALTPFPAGRRFGIDQFLRDLVARGTPPANYGFEGCWLDIGRPDDYDDANRRFEELRPLLLAPVRQRAAA
jgi:NDP-mannose synthase